MESKISKIPVVSGTNRIPRLSLTFNIQLQPKIFDRIIKWLWYLLDPDPYLAAQSQPPSQMFMMTSEYFNVGAYVTIAMHHDHQWLHGEIGTLLEEVQP